MEIQELLQQVRLEDVRLIERVARLKLDPSPNEGLSSLTQEPAEGQIGIEVNPISWGHVLETWFRMTLEDDVAQVSCAVAVLYQREDDAEIDSALRKEFIERVSVMAAYPYLRAEIQNQAADLRLGQLTLGILKQGEFQMEPQEEPAANLEDG